jgi:hypothetical protein
MMRLATGRHQSACSASGFYGAEDVYIGAPYAIGFAAEDA